MTPTAVVSIHDVEPGTLPDVLRLVELLADARVPPAPLLVVPGREWSTGDLDVLRSLAADGHPLAGHGWSHRAPSPTGPWHRFHALVLSRDRAEHLSRPRPEVLRRVRRCREWFDERRLAVSDLYVPPAWALGALDADDLRRLPFRWYETLTGILDARSGLTVRLPLVGFEADTPIRTWTLRASNTANLALGRWWDRPVRISIHPSDLDLALGRDLERLLRGDWNFATVEDVMMDAGGAGTPSTNPDRADPTGG